MASRCCSSVLKPRLPGQLIFDTVATQAALNSDWVPGPGCDNRAGAGNTGWEGGEGGCCAAAAALVVFLEEEHALTRTTNRQFVTNRANLLNIFGSRLKILPERRK